MNRYLKKLFYFLLSFLTITCFINAPAISYVLQGPHILDLMINRYVKTKSLLVSQRLIIYNKNQQEDPAELNENLRYCFPEKFRSDILSENVKRIHVVSKGMSLTVIDEKFVSDSETWFDWYKDILLYNSRMLIQEQLLILGVDVSVTSLGRFQGKTAYVLGAQYPDQSVPQLWIDKNTFKPFRWIISGKTDKDPESSREIHYLDWQQTDRVWYPMHIEFYENNILTREIKVEHIKIVPFFAEDLFDIAHIKSICTQPDHLSPNPEEIDELNEIQKTIEEFKRIYE